jgi:HTH-type transcriptional regulator, sugar sensing transcriptional regulator
MPSDVTQILIPFGFTSLESEIYTFLLKESPATGYRVAQAIGKAAANTYKAIESLQAKGAVLVEEGASRMCRAVPSDELLARLTRDFEWRRAEAEILLASLNSGEEDERIYALRSRAQVIERARHMLGGAEECALLACSAATLHELSDTLAACGRRKLKVYVACPEEFSLAGVQFAKVSSFLNEIRLAVDGSEYLLALFGKREDVIQALWTKSPYVAVSAHRGLAAELKDAELNPPKVKNTPGYAKLVKA